VVRRVEGDIDVPWGALVVDAKDFLVVGWAYSRASPVSRVEVWLGELLLGRAGLGRARPDVAAALGDPGAGLSGFDLRATAPPEARGTDASLRVTATLLDGTTEELGSRVLQLLPLRAESGTDLKPHPRPGGRARRRRGEEIRTLWSARGLDRGGSQLRMAEFIEHLARRGGFRITVHSPEDGPLRSVLEASGATVHIAQRAPFDDATGYERYVGELCALMEGRIDLVYGTTVTSFPAVDAAVRLGVPSVLRIGEAAPLRTVVAWLFGDLHPAVEAAAHRAVAGASAVLSNSAAAVRTYSTEGYSGRFVVLRTGVQLAAARAAMKTMDRRQCRERLGIGADERLLVCVGTLWNVKGQAVLVSALDLVRRQHPNLTCALIGDADLGYERAIGAFVVQRGLASAVRIVPFCEDLRPWWRAADAAVCPSETEATPSVLLEAMAHGVPVLGCRVGDLPDLIDPGVTGWLCDHSDLGSMVDGLTAVAVTPREVLDSMGAAAARVAGAHAQDEVLQRSGELLRAVAGGRLPRWCRADVAVVRP
jgi:glycosyltransferase involved in cell wall biosynthesis